MTCRLRRTHIKRLSAKVAVTAIKKEEDARDTELAASSHLIAYAGLSGLFFVGSP